MKNNRISNRLKNPNIAHHYKIHEYKRVDLMQGNRGDICLRMRHKDNAWSTRIARFLAELKIESVNIMVIRRHPSTVQNKTANTLKITKFLFIKVFFIHWVLHCNCV